MTDRAEIEKIAKSICHKSEQDIYEWVLMAVDKWEKLLDEKETLAEKLSESIVVDCHALSCSPKVKAHVEALTAQSSKHEAEKVALQKRVEELESEVAAYGDYSSLKQIQSLETLLAKQREVVMNFNKNETITFEGGLYHIVSPEEIEELISLTPSTIKDKLQSLRTHAEQMAGELAGMNGTHGEPCHHYPCNALNKSKEILSAYRQAFPEKEGKQ